MIIAALIALNAIVGYQFVSNLIEAIKVEDFEEEKKKKMNAGIHFVLWTWSVIFMMMLFIGG
ncbi:hypothetical protein [Bacillus sp. KH172YL63]|uniref:hypothetical protein n=1 Tax=Bacillus sp. KH172YL63 TaxID=2709784 RepID=UPI0013E4A61E|nr:hypothetical protein [Bacillus sp. KH172YL63]BCB05220.1 hypothetical protein KH172YL63_33530 [Bacillus sp. KH172YL63]